MSKHHCHYCNRPLNRYNRTRDHKIPKARGGARVPDNVVPCCRKCNGLKGCLTDDEFIPLRCKPGALRLARKMAEAMADDHKMVTMQLRSSQY